MKYGDYGFYSSRKTELCFIHIREIVGAKERSQKLPNRLEILKKIRRPIANRATFGGGKGETKTRRW